MDAWQSITLSEFELTRSLFALLCLLAAAHAFGFIFERLRMPRVIGEIAGGLLLGPTVFGFLAPDVHGWLFAAFPEEGELISAVYWLGLILLMFVSGFAIDHSVNRRDTRIVGSLLVGATVFPFAAGWAATQVYDFTPYMGPRGSPVALNLIIAIAVAVTSIPVISKIFLDLGIMKTRFARIVLTTATIQDVLLWIVLAIATGIAAGTQPSVMRVGGAVAVTLAFFAVSLLVMPRLIVRTTTARFNPLMRASSTGFILLICFAFSAMASLLQVNIVFGAFLAGIVVGMMPGRRFEVEKEQIRKVAMGFFVPVYFAVVGLKLDLVHQVDLRFLLGFLAFSTVMEGAGVFTAARAVGCRGLSSLNLSVAMNARGGPGIVLATIAFDLGIISETFFVTLVLVAIITSLAAGSWLRFVLHRGWRLIEDDPEETDHAARPVLTKGG